MIFSFKSQENKIIFISVPKPLRLATYLGSDFNNIFSYENKPKNVLVQLCFSLHFIPLDPDPRTQMNSDPTGSTSLL